MTLSVSDILSVVMISQFLFLIFALGVLPNANVSANRILQLVLAIFCFFLFEKLLIAYVVRIEKTLILRYGFISNILFYLLGPLVYIYIRRLIIRDNSPYFLSYVHFLPALIYALYILVHILFYEEIISETYLDIFGFTWQITCISSIVIYIFQSNKLLESFSRNQKHNLSFDQMVIKYVKIMLLIITAIMGCWLCHLLATSFYDYTGFGILFLMWVLYGILAYIITFYSLKYPQIFRLTLEETDPSKKSKNRLNEDEVTQLKARINSYIHGEKAYRRPELSLSVMAKEIDTSSNNLSWLLNNIYHQSFYDFINLCRVDDFLERIKRNEHKGFTLMSIAEEVGFKSKSTFYKAFKQKTNQTPSQYIKELDVNDSLA
ncbi:MAG: helix-turn-helix domain-containing protein [Bacteroidota bacterium]